MKLCMFSLALFIYKLDSRLCYVFSTVSFHFQSVGTAINSAQGKIVDDKRLGNIFFLTTTVAHHFIFAYSMNDF